MELAKEVLERTAAGRTHAYVTPTSSAL